MSRINAAIVQQVLDIALRQREADVSQHCKADDFVRGLQIQEGAAISRPGKLRGPLASLIDFALTLLNWLVP